MTKPIRFSCEATLNTRPEEIASQILDLARWPDFEGYGLLPGIRVAEFEIKTPEIVGTRIRVTNTDGSSHVEEIVEWQPASRLNLHMHEFSAPLSRLATGFDETWLFERHQEQTHVIRLFEMHPKSAWTQPVLWLIARLLKRAMARHLRQMHDAAAT